MSGINTLGNTLSFKRRTRTELLVVHCAATGPNTDVGAAEIGQWHLQRGFTAIGYHYVIRRNGDVETGRPEDAVGAHAVNFNAHSLGVCLVGGIDTAGKPDNNFTPAQFESLKRLLNELRARYPKARVLGHRDLSPDRNNDGRITPDEFIKACPSFDVAQWASEQPL